MKTQIIAGYEITLESGVWYRASREFAQRGETIYPVTITDRDGNIVWTVDDLTYEQANEFLNEFNNGKISFTGRVW